MAKREFPSLEDMALYVLDHSPICIDLDHFKSINDSHGHDAGDLVLQQVAALLRDVLPESVFGARLGGEEFGILCPDMDARQAAELAEGVREAMASRAIAYEGKQLEVTASIGVSRMMEDETKIEPAIKRADAAMDRAKHCGRNRVEVAGPGQ